MKTPLQIFLQVISGFLLVSLSATYRKANSGYGFWFKYNLISNTLLRKQYSPSITEFISENISETLSVAKKELFNAKTGSLTTLLTVLVDMLNTSDNILLTGYAHFL